MTNVDKMIEAIEDRMIFADVEDFTPEQYADLRKVLEGLEVDAD